MLEELFNACTGGDLEVLKKLPEKAFLTDEDDNDTPLMLAIRNGHKNIVQWLLESKKTDINATNDNNETALIVALSNPQQAQDLVAMLLQYGGIDLHIQSYFYGTALMYAIFSKQFDIAMLLLAKEESFQSSNHPGALYWAVAHDHEALVSKFIDLKVNLNNTKYEGFEYPEDWVWKSMPSDSPFKFREKDTTPLLLALKMGNHSMISLLLKNGADPNRMCEGQVPLLVAAENEDIESLDILLKCGANLELSINANQTIKQVILNDQYINERIKQFISQQSLPSKLTSKPSSPKSHFFSKMLTNNESEIDKELVRKLTLLLKEMSTKFDCSIASIKEKIPNALFQIEEQSISNNTTK